MSKNIIVIGAGPAGMTAAIFAARNGHTVTILEHMEKPGKKLLLTGSGRCNLTNTHIDNNCFNSENKLFPMKCYELFDYDKTMDYFHSIGLYTKEKLGYVYPISFESSSVLALLLAELKRLKVKLKYNQLVDDISLNTDNTFSVHVPDYSYICDSVIVATGSMASPRTGSTGDGYDFLRKLGHNIITPLPSLVPLKSDALFLKYASGVRVTSNAVLYIDNKRIKEASGELQILENYLSGIMIYELSHQAVCAVHSHKKVRIEFDFVPDISKEELIRHLSVAANNLGKSLTDSLLSIVNEKLAKSILKEAKIDPDITDEANILKASECLKQYSVNVTGYKDFTDAQSCQGGADTLEFNKNTLESKLVKGLYVCGELLDVDGICGGYNLQWAFSSGAIAGSNV